MLDLFVARSESEIQSRSLKPRLSLHGATYWYLHRYFVQASLTPGDFSFLNLYEDTQLDGYQLHRLRAELQEALVDLSARPQKFLVLVGWNGEVRAAETEDWRTIERAEAEQTVHEFVRALNDAEAGGQCVFAIGD